MPLMLFTQRLKFNFASFIWCATNLKFVIWKDDTAIIKDLKAIYTINAIESLKQSYTSCY
ncbi:hypothetical protein A9G44_07260 [Gilliamella sp. Occ4-3]|nr:hypothetical protein A9G44_07260 [Gilliamella apicola]